MRGWGESVFVGSEPERFEVEVLGVLRDHAPGTDAVLARFTGRGLEQSGVIAGMSGSPVWIEGKLVGAVAFAWPFASEAIGGITPIEAMRRIPAAAPWGRAPGRPVVALDDLLARRLTPDALEAAARDLVGAPGLEGRRAVAWAASGFSERGLGELTRALPTLAPTAGGRVDEAGPPLAGGSSVAALFVDGDLRLAATGTVTERTGDRILAFGHPVAGLGDVSLPMAPAEVLTVLPSRYSSFKIANSGPVIGEFTRDHSAGALGRVGAVPRTVPLAVRIAGPAPREFALKLAHVPQFVPLLAAIGTMGALDVAASSVGTRGLDLELGADLGVRGRIDLAQSFDGDGATQQAVFFLFAVLDFLVRNDLSPVEITGLEIELTPWADPRTLTVVGAHAARTRVEPGERLDLTVDLRAWRGEMERRTLAITVPSDLPAGRYTLLVGDGTSADAARLAIEPVAPVDFGQAIELLESLGSARELEVLGVLSGRGLALSGEVLPRLPASLRQIWAAAGGGGAKPLRLAVVQRERFASDRPVSGLMRIDVEIRRPQPTSGQPTSEQPTSVQSTSGNGGGAERSQTDEPSSGTGGAAPPPSAVRQETK